jgi:hypothetical protein
MQDAEGEGDRAHAIAEVRDQSCRKEPLKVATRENRAN